jgi:hypothetical protein
MTQPAQPRSDCFMEELHVSKWKKGDEKKKKKEKQKRTPASKPRFESMAPGRYSTSSYMLASKHAR